MTLHRQRLNAIVLRGLAQAVGTVAPLVILAAHGASAFGLFSILIAVAGLSVVLEWGLPLKVQNEVSRGGRERPHDRHWFLVETRFPLHLAVNLALAFAAWQIASTWLPQLFPSQVADILADHGTALLAVFLVAGGIGATYQGRSVLFGLGHIDKGFAITFVAALVSLLLVLAGIAAGASITALAVLVAAAPLIERILACLYCFGRAAALERHVSMPPPNPKSSALSQAPVAMMFLYLQLLSLVANNIDSIYAARANSLQAVGEYAFLLKLYGIPLLVANILSSAALPRLAVEAHDGMTGGRKTVMTLLRSNAILVVVVGLLVVLAANTIYAWITGAPGDLRLLATLMLVDTTVLALRGVLTTYVNAAEILWLNVVGNTVFAAAAIGLKVLLVDGFGIYGLVAANIAAYVCFLLPFHWLAFARATRR